MNDGLDRLFEGTAEEVPAELRLLLHQLLDLPGATSRLLDQRCLHATNARVHRLRFAIDGRVCSLVTKRLEPAIARRNELVATRWLPAVGLGASGPVLLGIAAQRDGRCVWHAYEDLGDWALDAAAPDRERVKTAVELVARIHTRFADHPLLAECRLHGGDLGIAFLSGSVRDAIRCLERLRPPGIDLSSERAALRDRLLERLYAWIAEQPRRAAALAELGGPETLLHGDLWTTNTFVLPAADGWRARLIDWDHAAAGPVSYDLSTFLLRFRETDRPWILEAYKDAVSLSGWRLPSDRDLNLLFDTAERARFANTIIWPAMALIQEGAEWGFARLVEIEEWINEMRPVLHEENPSRVRSFVPP